MSAPWHFAFADRRILMVREGDHLALPDEPALREALNGAEARQADIRVRDASGRPCRVWELPDDFAAPEGTEMLGLRALHPLVRGEIFAAAGTALHKLDWLRTTGFCSRCGTPTVPHAAEEARACPACGHVQFPRVAPAVIVLVERDGEMLLGRSPGFTPGVYSTLAGFVEPGESLEDAVHREIREEVGVEVTDVRYFGSQPWPFPHSLMVGFTAHWLSGDIAVDGVEIEDADWYSASRLPPGLPTTFSIARRLVDDFLDRHGRGE